MKLKRVREYFEAREQNINKEGKMKKNNVLMKS